MVMPRLGVKNIIINWPADTREIAQNIINKYGEPNEATPSMLIWHNNGPWKRTIVYRDAVKHNFPFPHKDVVEQFINYEIPMEKACELNAFDGSIVFYRTRGEMSACSQDEQYNILALNLAHDIMRDKKTFEHARYYYAKNITDNRQHKPTPYMEKLLFTPEKKTADPDESTISEKELTQAMAG
jgi:hypothetical protein